MSHEVTINGQRLEITDEQIRNGTLQPVAGRQNGDVELIIRRHPAGTICLHVHARDGGTGGGMSLNRQVDVSNTPHAIVAAIVARGDYRTVVRHCSPAPSRAEASNNWRRG